MYITKCDVCKKKITNEPTIMIRHQLKHYDLCAKCAEPAIKIVENIKK